MALINTEVIKKLELQLVSITKLIKDDRLNNEDLENIVAEIEILLKDDCLKPAKAKMTESQLKASKMTANEKKIKKLENIERILGFLAKEGFSTVKNIAKLMEVSESSIYKLFKSYESKGWVEKHIRSSGSKGSKQKKVWVLKKIGACQIKKNIDDCVFSTAKDINKPQFDHKMLLQITCIWLITHKRCSGYELNPKPFKELIRVQGKGTLIQIKPDALGKFGNIKVYIEAERTIKSKERYKALFQAYLERFRRLDNDGEYAEVLYMTENKKAYNTLVAYFNKRIKADPRGMGKMEGRFKFSSKMGEFAK